MNWVLAFGILGYISLVLFILTVDHDTKPLPPPDPSCVIDPEEYGAEEAAEASPGRVRGEP